MNIPRTIGDVIELITRGKIQEHLNRNVELKSSWKEEHGHKISSLGNKLDIECAWLILGIDDKGNLLAKDDSWAKSTEETVSQHINNKLDPIQACKGIQACEINGAFILILELRNPGDVVYWGENAYGAAGTTVSRLAPEQILELRLKLPGLTDFTRQSVSSIYNPRLVDLFTQRVRTAGHYLEQGLSMAILDTLGLKGTQAARILFGDCRFRVVKYDTSGDPLSNESISGLYTLLTEEFQESLQHWPSVRPGKSSHPYPKKALQEALANAVAHAAYFEQGGDIIIEVHPNFIIISNLCIRESNYFANRWFSRAHKTVNSYMMEILRVAKHVDELGRGKNLIFSESITHGKKPPNVNIQGAGRYFRWALTLNGNTTDARQLRVFKGIKDHYGASPKALIAQALVLWCSKKVSEIRNYVDDTFSDLFAEVLSDLDGPFFYSENEDKIVLHRWVRVMLEEGKDAKQLTPAEERNELSFLRRYCHKYENGYITPKLLRKIIHLGDNPSAKSYASRLLSKWVSEGHITRSKPGLYKFNPDSNQIAVDLKEIIKKIFTNTAIEEIKVEYEATLPLFPSGG
ncbi:MAG: hypothetical protein GJT30_11000 [Geobacter sp.]|nr:hypothetical protein [Geobacter sp.]